MLNDCEYTSEVNAHLVFNTLDQNYFHNATRQNNITQMLRSSSYLPLKARRVSGSAGRSHWGMCTFDRVVECYDCPQNMPEKN